MNNEEQWLPIPGWEGRYEVSDMGRIRSLTRAKSGTYIARASKAYKLGITRRKRTGSPKIIAQDFKFGNLRATLYNGKKQVKITVPKVVLSAFRPYGDPDSRVKHRNHNRLDNRVENLRRVGGSTAKMTQKDRLNLYEIKQMFLRGHSTQGIGFELGIEPRSVYRTIIRMTALDPSLPRYDVLTDRAETNRGAYRTELNG